MRDDKGKVIPIAIDYTEVIVKNKISNEFLMNETKLIQADHDHPSRLEFMCEDKDSIEVSIRWLPHIYDEEKFIQIMHEFYKKRKKAFTFWKERKDKVSV